MKYIEIAFNNKKVGDALNKEFEGCQNIGLINCVKKDDAINSPGTEKIEDYFPQPLSVGTGPDCIQLLEGFILGIIVNGSYDLMKLGLKRSIKSISNIVEGSSSNWIKIITGNWAIGLSKKQNFHDITFVIPCRVDEQFLEVITKEIKTLDRELKKFLCKVGNRVNRKEYEFTYSKDGWELKVK